MESCNKCKVNLIFTSCTKICPSCGTETRFLDNSLPGYAQKHSIFLSSSYSRRYRFHSLLLKTVCFHNGPSTKDNIWKFLEENGPYENSIDIQKSLQKMNAKNKRYDMLPIFTRAFCKVKMKRASSKQIRTAMLLYDALESRWKQAKVKRFFSYFYLLEKILTKVGAAFSLAHCKKLICKKRRSFYDEMIQKLGGLCFKQQISDEQKVMFLKFFRRHENVPRQVKSPPPDDYLVQRNSLRLVSQPELFLKALSHERMRASNPGKYDHLHVRHARRYGMIQANRALILSQ